MKILIVEDEPKTGEYLRQGLSEAGFVADLAQNGSDGLHLALQGEYDLVILDVMLPGLDGWQVLQSLRNRGLQMPVLFLTARDQVEDRVKGLELGADDYLTKPFEFQELVLRIRALDRRRASRRPPVYELSGLKLDPFRREVYWEGRYVALTRKQFAVLEVLMSAEGGVVSAEDLLERAWDENADPFTNAVRITVSGLRKRLGEPWLIGTVPGAGYRIEGPASAEK